MNHKLFLLDNIFKDSRMTKGKEGDMGEGNVKKEI